MFSVNTNAGAFAALQNLNTTSQSLEVTQSRVNTGLKVASARDDAALYSIAQNMRGDVAGFRAVNNSLSRAQSELDVAIAGAEAISDLLIEMKEKAVAAKDVGLDNASRTSLNNDYLQLLDQVNSIAENASFNGRNLLTGDTLSAITDSTGSTTITNSSSSLTTSALSIDQTSIVGINVDGAEAINGGAYSSATMLRGTADRLAATTNYVNANFPGLIPGTYNTSTGWFDSNGNGYPVAAEMSSQASGATVNIFAHPFDYDQLYVSSGTIYLADQHYYSADGTALDGSASLDSNAKVAVDAVEAAITSVNDVLSELGATSNRLAIQQQFAGKLSDSLEVGIGNLVDADLAKESANLQAFQTKQQLGLQALSIANQGPQSVLALFR